MSWGFLCSVYSPFDSTDMLVFQLEIVFFEISAIMHYFGLKFKVCVHFGLSYFLKTHLYSYFITIEYHDRFCVHVLYLMTKIMGILSRFISK